MLQLTRLNAYDKRTAELLDNRLCCFLFRLPHRSQLHRSTQRDKHLAALYSITPENCLIITNPDLQLPWMRPVQTSKGKGKAIPANLSILILLVARRNFEWKLAMSLYQRSILHLLQEALVVLFFFQTLLGKSLYANSLLTCRRIFVYLSTAKWQVP